MKIGLSCLRAGSSWAYTSNGKGLLLVVGRISEGKLKGNEELPGLLRLPLFLEVEAQRGGTSYKETHKKGE